MAGSSEDRRRRGSPADRRDDGEPPEEGELVPGCDSDVNTEDYYNNHDYYSSTDSDETTSDCNTRSIAPASYGGAGATSPFSAAAAAKSNNGSASSSSPVAAPAMMLACPICGKEFRNRKAVCGHMKVHVHQHGAIGRHDEQQGIRTKKDKPRGIKRNAAAVAVGGWGGTGKRGRPASPDAPSDQSTAMVVADSKVVLKKPMPLAFAPPNSSSSPAVRTQSATPNPTPTSSVPTASGTPPPGLSSVPIASTTMTNVKDESGGSPKPMHGDAMETAVAGAANPPTEAADVHLHAPPSPSPPPAVVHATSAAHERPIGPPPPPAADAEERVQLPPVHPPPHPIAPPLAAAAAGRQNPNGYTCKVCGYWFATHQGLGGHMAGHKTRELAAVPCRPDDAKRVKKHPCKHCDAVFDTGVQLGGHMRAHYTGPAIVPKRKPPHVVQPLPPPAALEPAPTSAAVAGRLRLFGFDIVAGVQTPAVGEAGSSSL